MERNDISEALRRLANAGLGYRLTDNDKKVLRIAANEIDDAGAFADKVCATLKNLI